MATYYGHGPDGQMGHIRLRESMEEWHVRCAEQGEAIRRLREDVGTKYSRKANFTDMQALKQRQADVEIRLDELEQRLSTLADWSAEILTRLRAAGDPTPPPGAPLPCPECGGPWDHGPFCG